MANVSSRRESVDIKNKTQTCGLLVDPARQTSANHVVDQLKFMLAIEDGDLSIVNELLNQGVDVEQQTEFGHREHVFPSPIRPKNAISNNAILTALRRMGYQGKMTGHGFRSLAMGCIKQELGYRHEVVDRQLAHMPRSKIDRAYDRADFLQERIKMMQDWADYIEKMGR